MGQTDKQFGGFLRMLIARMKGEVDALEKGGQQEALDLMRGILTDLQNTLED